MDIKIQVRQLLRMCGHALVRTVHERLDVYERQNDELRLHIANIAETQGTLLQAAIYMIENLRLVQDASHGERALLGQQYSFFDSLRSQFVHLSGAVEAIKNDLKTLPGQDFSLATSVATSEYEFLNPETGLMSFLFSGLPTRKAMDIGAHVGRVSESLLNAGFEVYAFEPNPLVYGKLMERIGAREGLYSFNFALGAAEGELPLHIATDKSELGRYQDDTMFSSLVPHSMPEDLPFTECKVVPVRTLASLHQEGMVPADVSLLKIDTEGFDLDVIRGMGDYRYPVVVTEYWDKEIPFAKSGVPYTLHSMVGEMRLRGYPYHIVVYRIWGNDQVAYYCNLGQSVPNSFGNCFFFRDYRVFTAAGEWCSAVLPKTYFKPLSRR